MGEDGAPFFDKKKDVAFAVSGKVWVNNHAHILRSKKHVIIDDFLKHILNTVSYEMHINGSTRDKLTQFSMNNIRFPLPSLREQKNIVAVLFKQTSHIDNLIKEKQTFIKLLEEKRQALISHVVTKGLDDKVEMKDSGVEWIGKVPKHWTIGRLKHCLSIKNGQDYKDVETDDLENSFPVYGSGGIFKRATDFLHDGESILFGRKGTIDKPLHVNDKFWSVDTMFYSILKSTAHGRFIYCLATTIPFKYYQTNTALPSMTQGDLLNNPVAFPSKKEQIEIADFLESSNNKIDSLLAETKNSIDLLKERRSALISAAVTGKIDVRETI